MPILTHVLAFLGGCAAMAAFVRWAVEVRHRNRQRQLDENPIHEHRIPLTPEEKNEVHDLFLRLWTAAGSTYYNKGEWLRLDLLLRIHSLDSPKDEPREPQDQEVPTPS